MGSVSTSVGCAVGIPIGVGIIIAFAFWYRLQRRFKKELEDDKDLEHEIYDDTAYISFNNLDSLKKEPQQTTNDIPVTTNDKDNHKTNVYIPAYRRQINSLHYHNIQTPDNGSSNTNIDTENTINVPPPVMSKSSIRSSLQNVNDSKQVRQISVYDQMVPLVNPASIFDSKQNLNDHISFQSDSTYKNDSFNIRNLQYQDLGSYYPAVTSSANNSVQNFKINPSSPSLNNSTNIFTTPNSKKNNLTTVHPIQDNSKNDSSSQSDIESGYILKNNYDVNDKEDKIVEEDQYENEFTNYKENRRQFLDSLRPHNVEQ